MSLFCTSEPTIWQRESTTIVMQNDPALTAAQHAATTALKNGNEAEANRVLQEAINKIGGKK